jgi:hypothetical protein
VFETLRVQVPLSNSKGGGFMKVFKKARIILGALGLMVIMSQASNAQLNSTIAPVTLTATLGESLTVSAAPTTVTFALVPSGTVGGSAPVVITTSWALAKSRATMKVFASFTSATALTDGSGDNIPTANVLGAVNAIPAAPFTGGTGPFGVNSIQVYSTAVGAGTYNSTHTDNLGLSINTTGLGLPAAVYNGTLNIQAQAL